jgi:hypothetical protein
VRKNLDPTRFTIRTMAKRLDRVGDLWRPVIGDGVDLVECLERLMKSGAGGGTAVGRRVPAERVGPPATERRPRTQRASR